MRRGCESGIKAVAQKWKVVAGLHTSPFGKLATPDDKGAVPIVSVIKEAAIRDAIVCGTPPCAPLLLVKS